MSDEPFQHLNVSAARALLLPVADRIKYVKRPIWVPYEAAKLAEKALGGLVDHPREDRMPCLMLVGESNNGKSTLLNRFARQRPPIMDEDGHLVSIPVLIVSAPASANERELLVNIVKAFGVPYNPESKMPSLLGQIERLLREYQVKLLIIDEFNNISTGTPVAQRLLLNRLKLLSKSALMSIAVAGTREVLNFLNLDSQFSSRFEPSPLPRWVFNDESCDLLASLERGLPFPEQSLIDEGGFASKILEEAEHTIGGILGLLVKMSEYAIENGEPRLTTPMIRKSGWVRPSLRARDAHAKL